jgi:dihydrofolate reductase
MRLTLTMFLTLDGVYQAPGEPREDRSGGFDQGGWQVPYVDDDMMKVVGEWFDAADAFLFGRKTYDIFAGYWPSVTDPANNIALQLNRLPKYVVSNTLGMTGWANTTILKGDVVSAVAKLKAQSGRELQVHGCGELAQALMSHDLVDEYRLCFHPVVLGHGKRLFQEGTPSRKLKLLNGRTTSTGVVVNVYQPAGQPAYGDFGIDQLGERVREDFTKGIVESADAARRGAEKGIL